jgi:stress-induced morphogen
MVTAVEITELIKAGIPDAQIRLEDLTGGEDHWSATIVSEAFAGATRVQQHQMVYATLAEPLKGPLHALQLRTLTPEKAREAGILED